MAFLSTRWNPRGHGNTVHGHTTNLSKRNLERWRMAGLPLSPVLEGKLLQGSRLEPILLLNGA